MKHNSELPTDNQLTDSPLLQKEMERLAQVWISCFGDPTQIKPSSARKGAIEEANEIIRLAAVQKLAGIRIIYS